MLVSVTSCATDGDEPTKTGEAQTQAKTDPAETEDPAYSLGLKSDLNYGNAAVDLLVYKNDAFPSEIASEKLGTGVVPDAIYERNVSVEDLLKVKLVCHEQSDVQGELNRDIQSGLGDYAIVSTPTFGIVSSTVEGKFIDLNRLDNIDLGKHYWTQGYNDMVTFTESKMQFLASGAPAVSMYRYTYMTLYNKSLFKDNQIPDLYDTVIKGEWTLDKQYAITKDHYIDADGSGAPSAGDFYGFVTGNCVSVDPYMVATETHLITKDADTQELMFNDAALSRLSDVCDKTQLLYNDASTYVYKGSSQDNVTTADIINHFTAKHALMVTSRFVVMEMYYSDLAPLSYGIAPMPKFDTNQKQYRSYVQDRVTAFGISAVVADSAKQEMCAATLEAMAYYSNNLVRPAYYNTALSDRYMQDPQSKEMLDLIFDTLYFDFSSTCANMLAVNTRDSLRGLLSGNTNTIASSTKTWSKSIQLGMKKINKSLERLERMADS
jgi:hypothetical protein